MEGDVAAKASPHSAHPQAGPKAVERGGKGVHSFEELGVTREQAKEARRRMERWAYLWEDPSMDVYDDER